MKILRYQDYVLYWKKSYAKPQQFLDQFLQVHYFQLNEFDIFQQRCLIGEVLLFSKIAYCLQQNFHLDFHTISFLFFLKERHKSFFVLYKVFYFLHSYFIEKCFVIQFASLLHSTILS